MPHILFNYGAPAGGLLVRLSLAAGMASLPSGSWIQIHSSLVSTTPFFYDYAFERFGIHSFTAHLLFRSSTGQLPAAMRDFFFHPLSTSRKANVNQIDLRLGV
jgi:hypothetical protein